MHAFADFSRNPFSTPTLTLFSLARNRDKEHALAMASIRKLHGQLDFTLLILWGMCAGIGGGILAGALASHAVNPYASTALFIAYEGALLVLVALILRTILKRRAAKLAKLRAQGILPDAASQRDDDVIRLANAGLREEAALVYQELHGGPLDAARFVTGLDRQGKTLVGILLFVFVVLITTSLYSAAKGNSANIVMNTAILASLGSSNLVIFMVRAKRLRENREQLARGILSSPDSACLFRKPVMAGVNPSQNNPRVIPPMSTPRSIIPSRFPYQVGGLLFTIACAILALYLSDTLAGKPLSDKVHLGVTTIICILVVWGHYYLFERKIAALTEALRKAGTLPAKENASDADIIRLAKNGMTEEAALLHHSLHKGMIEKAMLTVGIDGTKAQLSVQIFLFAFCSALPLYIGIHKGKTPLILLGILFAIAGLFTLVLHYRQKKQAIANRQSIARGILPGAHN